VRTRDALKERAIRDHALSTIVAQGFDGLSMQKLARAAGVSPATIYIYFKDRDDLILSLFREESHKMGEATLVGFDVAMSFAEGLRVQWTNRVRYCLENPLQMHFLEQIRYSPFHARVHTAKGGGFIAAMHAFVENSIRRGELIRIPVEVYWSVAFAPLYQLVKFHMHGRGLRGAQPFALNDKLISQTLGLVLKALTPARKGTT
jgi:AcrR family transcriptional regulator